MENTLITICARGGSKGIPGKNIKLINGKPLIGFTIEFAQSFAKLITADIGLSTDSDQISSIASDFGLNTQYQRGSKLASDTAGKLDTIKNLVLYEEHLKNKKYNYIIDLDVTSPLRTIKDLKKAYRVLTDDPNALNIFSVSPAKRNPYFNMVEKKSNGYYSLIVPVSNILSRQTAPQVFDMNASFYIYRREYFELGMTTAISDKTLIYEMKHICFDLDDPIDFVFMEYLLQNNLLDFEL